jgi:hypothetical protein
MEQDPGGNGHVGVGGPGRPGGPRAGEGERSRAACLHVCDPSSSHDAADSRVICALHPGDGERARRRVRERGGGLGGLGGAGTMNGLGERLAVPDPTEASRTPAREPADCHHSGRSTWIVVRGSRRWVGHSREGSLRADRGLARRRAHEREVRRVDVVTGAPHIDVAIRPQIRQPDLQGPSVAEDDDRGPVEIKPLPERRRSGDVQEEVGTCASHHPRPSAPAE